MFGSIYAPVVTVYDLGVMLLVLGLFVVCKSLCGLALKALFWFNRK